MRADEPAQPASGAAPTPGAPLLDRDAALFYLALGAVGDVQRAAELAGVEPGRAERWADAVERPSWATQRSEAATRLFQVANRALDRVEDLIGGDDLPRSAPHPHEATDRLLTLEDEEDGDPPQAGPRPAPEPGVVPLRELVMVAERFFAAALKLDQHVGFNGAKTYRLELADQQRGARAGGAARAASGAAHG